jgi:hypothetical protein
MKDSNVNEGAKIKKIIEGICPVYGKLMSVYVL